MYKINLTRPERQRVYINICPYNHDITVICYKFQCSLSLPHTSSSYSPALFIYAFYFFFLFLTLFIWIYTERISTIWSAFLMRFICLHSLPLLFVFLLLLLLLILSVVFISFPVLSPIKPKILYQRYWITKTIICVCSFRSPSLFLSLCVIFGYLHLFRFFNRLFLLKSIFMQFQANIHFRLYLTNTHTLCWCSNKCLLVLLLLF